MEDKETLDSKSNGAFVNLFFLLMSSSFMYDWSHRSFLSQSRVPIYVLRRALDVITVNSSQGHFSTGLAGEDEPPFCKSIFGDA